MRTVIKKAMSGAEWGMFAISILLIVAQVWLETAIPAKISDITNLVQVKESPVSQILVQGGIMVIYAVAALLAAVLVVYLISRIGAKVSTRLRAEIYEKTMRFSMEEVGKFGTSSLITRCSDDVIQVQMFISAGLQYLIKSPLLAVFVIFNMTQGHIYWTFAALGAVFLITILLSVIIKLSMPAVRGIQEKNDALTNVDREHIMGIRVVNAYHAEEFQKKRFEQANEGVTGLNFLYSKAMAVFNPGANAIVYGLSIAVYVLGAFIISSAGADEKLGLFSSMLSFVSYSTLLLSALVYLILIVSLLPGALVSVRRISEVIEQTIRIQDGREEELSTKEKGTVTFSHVSFAYPGGKEYVLKDISFQAKKGETVAIIGATGSGKSSILNLIPRMYDTCEGEILVDGVNVKEYQLKDLRNRIGYVPQKSFLFSGTIAGNIGFGDNGRLAASLKEIEKAARVGQAEEFILGKEQGYDSCVEQGGSNFSGGQRQRLTISRAICRDPEIFLFDDSFSALDYQTDSKLRKKLRETAGDATMIIVAQRISTIRNADRILVIDEGRLVGEGTHEQLMEECSVYQEIASSQLKNEKEAG